MLPKLQSSYFFYSLLISYLLTCLKTHHLITTLNLPIPYTTTTAITMPSRDKYTDPELRDQVKEEIHNSDKGGKPGQWSARKVPSSFPLKHHS